MKILLLFLLLAGCRIHTEPICVDGCPINNQGCDKVMYETYCDNLEKKLEPYIKKPEKI